jgi:hypothetical protein
MTDKITTTPDPSAASFAIIKEGNPDPVIYHGVRYVQVEKGGELWLMGPGRSIIAILNGLTWSEVFPVDPTGARIG